jgi:probable HAF family extracellular repeat protein
MKYLKFRYPLVWRLGCYGTALLLSQMMFNPVHAYDYKVIEISSSSFSSTGNAINNLGQVAGTDDNIRIWGDAYLYNPSGSKTTIMSVFPQMSNADAKDLNDLGQVVGTVSPGYAQVCILCQRGFKYKNGIMKAIPTLGGKSNTANGININGQITGRSLVANNAAIHAYLYGGGIVTDLGTLGGTHSLGSGINDYGQVTGASTLPGNPLSINQRVNVNSFYNLATHAYLYDKGKMKDLGTLGGYALSSGGTRVNNKGQVTGWSNLNTSGYIRAFIYSNGKMKNLGVLSGGEHSVGNDINNYGQVVGQSQKLIYPAFRHAFLYKNGIMTDLNTLIDPNSDWVLYEATSINDAGWITGVGIRPNSATYWLPKSFLAIPCPSSSC